MFLISALTLFWTSMCFHFLILYFILLNLRIFIILFDLYLRTENLQWFTRFRVNEKYKKFVFFKITIPRDNKKNSKKINFFVQLLWIKLTNQENNYAFVTRRWCTLYHRVIVRVAQAFDNIIFESQKQFSITRYSDIYEIIRPAFVTTFFDEIHGMKMR